MTRLAFGFWVTLSLLAVAQVGHAQNYEGFRLDRLELPPTIEDGIALQLPNTLGHLRWSAALTLNYTHSPLVIEPQPEVLGEGRVVADRLQAQVVAALGLAEFAEIHARAPVVLSQGGDRIPLVSDPRPAAFAAADVTVGGSLRLLGAAERGPQLGLVGELVLPSGSQEAYGSDKGVGPRVLLTAAHVVPSAVTIALQLGGLYRPERQYADAQLGSEALGALGVYVTSVPRLVVGAEVLGALALASSNSASHTAKSLEAQLGVRYTAAPGFAAQLAAGAGLNNDVGVPQLRALLSLGFAPPKHAPPPPPPPRPEPPPPLDTDRDGIVDDQDHCPFEAEDPDQFQDEDGCPDTDNDGDGVLDKLDRCPLQAEDPDGYSDADGCPDMDNDEDGLPDERDKCPLEPEDKDGFMDQDGCPDTDNDGDGVADDLDKCPLSPGSADAKGCPKAVRLEEKQIKILSRIRFRSGKAKLMRSAEPILEEVRAVLQANPWIKLIRVEGHTDDRGSAKFNLKLSQRRAGAVTAWFEQRGVDPNRLQAQGFGEDRPLTDNRTKQGRSENRRVEFHIVDPPEGVSRGVVGTEQPQVDQRPAPATQPAPAPPPAPPIPSPAEVSPSPRPPLPAPQQLSR